MVWSDECLEEGGGLGSFLKQVALKVGFSGFWKTKLRKWAGTRSCRHWTVSWGLPWTVGTPGEEPVLIPSSLFFFCLTQLHGDFLALLEVWGPLSAFSRCSVRIIPHVDAFLTYLWGDGELHVLFLCHLHSLPTDLWDIIYIQCKVIGYNISDWNLSKIFWMLNV